MVVTALEAKVPEAVWTSQRSVLVEPPSGLVALQDEPASNQ